MITNKPDQDYVMFARTTDALGRNGSMKCIGVHLWPVVHLDRTLYIEPITSTGRIGRAYIRVPLEDIDALITRLSQIRDETQERSGSQTGDA